MNNIKWIIVLVLLVLTASMASANVITVTSNPLWTDSGISLTSADTINIFGASGIWSWGASYGVGPDGDYQPSLAWDEWIQNGYHALLIGFIGTADPNTLTANNPDFFVIGTSSLSLSGKTGELWFGFNDDYSSHAIYDNWGSITVNADKNPQVPEPGMLILFGTGILGLFAYGRHAKG